jgi:hypothetical protein
MSTKLETTEPKLDSQEPPKKDLPINKIGLFIQKQVVTLFRSTMYLLPPILGINVYMTRNQIIFDHLSLVYQMQSNRNQSVSKQSSAPQKAVVSAQNSQSSTPRKTVASAQNSCAPYDEFKRSSSNGAAQALSGMHQLMYSPSRLDLKGMDLAGAQLQEWKFLGIAIKDGANLSHSNFRCSNLKEANLTGADLTGADLTGANLTGANLTGAKLGEKSLKSFKDITLCRTIGVDRTLLQDNDKCKKN